ncbi:MAG TPA: PAS domain S-box protein [Nocardiopsis listeri]|uniref:PAS domain S-box protein n=1 Tax=Nocardiopsis listeri TaxID=53440 RepID=UPI001E14EC1F|nr:PAS domain S-box protein [Nocardiopsis listeri]HJE57089.1 PAS domain S-box protein [Nocardiopsis listeri]
MSSERAPLSAEAMLASSADAVIGIDGELRVTFWNPAAERMLGWSADEVIGGELPIVPPELRPEHGAVLEQVRAGTPLTIFSRRMRRDGTALDVRVSTGCVYDDQGRHAGWVLVLYPREKESQAQTSAMERARLVRRLTDVVADINADLSLKSVLDRITSSLTELTGADAGGFVLLEEDKVRLVSLTHLSGELYGFSASLETSLFGELLRSGKSVLLANSDTRSLEDLIWADLPGLHTIALCVSNAQGRPYGALYALYSRRKVGHVELELLELLASHAGVAIGNAMAYEELKLQRAREQAVADSSADGIAVLDINGKVRKWNRSAAELTGYTFEEMEGKHPPFPIPVAHGDPVKHKNEGGRWLEILMARIPSTDEWVVDFRDITAQKALEEEREFFLASTGHELRTPVTVIQGYAAMLSRKGERLGPAGRQEASEIILDRARALAKLVERLRLGSDVASGEMTLDRVPFDLVELLGQSVAAFRPLAERQELVLDSEGPLCTVGDPLVTGMVMDQLLENALKFSPEGGRVRVHVDVDEDEDTLTIHVDDEGIGIDPGDEEQIFERFFQSGERGDRRGYGGLGIGLYIVRQLVREQGGEVTAHRLTKGTRMRITVPRHRGEDPGPDVVLSETSAAGEGGGVPSARS